MQQFYTPEIDIRSRRYVFSEQESKHIARVLRKKSGETVRLTNGKGYLFWGKLEVITPKKCAVEITKHEQIMPAETQIHIAVAPTKSLDRFEWFLEKATELGVHRITPILCSRSERKHLKIDRCNKVIVAALKQSLGAYLPILDPLTMLKDLNTEASLSCVAHCHDSDKIALIKAAENQSTICVLIGPEGDFTKEEVEWAVQHKIQPVNLSKRRLRTETAALVALHTVILLQAE